MYTYSRFAHEGGLIAYGIDLVGQFGEAAAHLDRVLKGTKPADSVQAPTRYTMVINLKSAKALGLSISPTLLAAADEVIEQSRR